MNLFIAGHGVAPVDVDCARRALAELISELGFFSADEIETWRSRSGQVAIACVGHPDRDVGGVRYRSFEPDRAALFSGRPVWWPEGRGPDGLLPLDPAFYHAPADEWAGGLDGRCTAVRAQDATLQVYTDPVGAYPVFTAGGGDLHWFSNSADALRRVVGDDSLDELALATVLGGGWSLGGHPLWRAVRHVDRGVVITLGPDGAERRLELLPLAQIISMLGAGFDAAQAARDLVAVTGALAGWPGRPDVVPVTGGHDSRVVLAAALRAGFPFTACTGGAPGDPDVEVAARLCAIAGLPHVLLEPDPHGDRFTDVFTAARVTALASGGTATLADAAGFPLGPREGPLVLWHSGQGGEIGRAYWGIAETRIPDRLYAKYVGRRPGRAEIVSPEAGRLIHAWISEFTEQTRDAGAESVDISDLFYLFERTAGWAPPTHGVVELIRDTTSPIWSVRMLPHLLGPPASERVLERFHLGVLREIGPQFVDQPFQDGSTWPTDEGPLRGRLARAQTLAAKGRAELRRRAAGRKAPQPAAAAQDPTPTRPADPLDQIIAVAREVTQSQPQHPAWDVLNRPRVERLLRSPAVSLDEMSKYYVWRLLTVFLGFS